jgi:hypothetical protein
MVDRVIWASSYDVPEDKTPDFLAWLHESHLPALARRPGYDWVAHYRRVPSPTPDITKYMSQMAVDKKDAPNLGRGTQYLLMAGATTLQPFVSPSVDQADAAAPAETRAMLALRQGIRSSIMKDVMRVNGPAAATRPLRGAPAPRIQFGTYRVNDGMEPGLWKFYLEYRFAQISASPGAVSARSLFACTGWANIGILYEFESATAHAHFLTNFERPAVERDRNNPKEMQTKVISIHEPGSPVVGERLWPPVKA